MGGRRHTGSAQNLALSKLAEDGNLAGVIIQVEEEGANVNYATPYGRDTPLHFAASKGHLGVVKYLIEHGASTSKRNADGDTPLRLARANNHIDVVEFLLTHRAKE